MIKKLINFHTKPIHLNCEICSMPLPSTEWIRNGKNILNDQSFTVKTSSISIHKEDCIRTTLIIQVRH